jgi:hypothetical protein
MIERKTSRHLSHILASGRRGGWVNYFHLHNSTRVFVGNAFLEQRMRKYLQGFAVFSGRRFSTGFVESG